MNRQAKVDWNKAFPVSHLTREDIVDAGFPRWQVAGLSDDDVALIAMRMGDAYADHGYHDDILDATEYVLLLHPRKNIGGELTSEVPPG